jgi:hypothetical protein
LPDVHCELQRGLGRPPPGKLVANLIYDRFFIASTNFIQGLNEQGYVEGRNVEILYRSAENRYDRLPAPAADLMRRRVAVMGHHIPRAINHILY